MVRGLVLLPVHLQLPGGGERAGVRGSEELDTVQSGGPALQHHPLALLPGGGGGRVGAVCALPGGRVSPAPPGVDLLPPRLPRPAPRPRPQAGRARLQGAGRHLHLHCSE